MTKDVFVKFRATKEERASIKRAAELAGSDISKLMRDAVLGRVARIERKERQGNWWHLPEDQRKEKEKLIEWTDLLKNEGNRND